MRSQSSLILRNSQMVIVRTTESDDIWSFGFEQLIDRMLNVSWPERMLSAIRIPWHGTCISVMTTELTSVLCVWTINSSWSISVIILFWRSLGHLSRSWILSRGIINVNHLTWHQSGIGFWRIKSRIDTHETTKQRYVGRLRFSLTWILIVSEEWVNM